MRSTITVNLPSPRSSLTFSRLDSINSPSTAINNSKAAVPPGGEVVFKQFDTCFKLLSLTGSVIQLQPYLQSNHGVIIAEAVGLCHLNGIESTTQCLAF